MKIDYAQHTWSQRLQAAVSIMRDLWLQSLFLHIINLLAVLPAIAVFGGIAWLLLPTLDFDNPALIFSSLASIWAVALPGIALIIWVIYLAILNQISQWLLIKQRVAGATAVSVRAQWNNSWQLMRHQSERFIGRWVWLGIRGFWYVFWPLLLVGSLVGVTAFVAANAQEAAAPIVAETLIEADALGAQAALADEVVRAEAAHNARVEAANFYVSIKHTSGQFVALFAVLLLIVLIAYRGLKIFPASTLLLHDDCSVAAALKRSIAATKGRWWQIFGAMVGLVALMLGVVIGLEMLVAASGLISSWLAIALMVVVQIIQSLLLPIVAISFFYLLALQVAEGR